jgi:hypothetical protein
MAPKISKMIPIGMDTLLSVAGSPVMPTPITVRVEVEVEG